ncbi:hypothetical protein PTKIN_Ptkin16aG0079800 [Pterospermum kingtungense]
MELLLLLVKIIVTALLIGFSSMFIRLLDALVLTPKRVSSKLGIQETRANIPPSSLPGNFDQASKKITQFKGKQVQHICFHLGKYRLCTGTTIRIWPNYMGTLTPEGNYGV